MGDAVLGYVVQRICDLLIDEAVFLFEVKDQVEWVKEELKTMQCFLKDADTKSKGDENVKNWVRQVREIAYQAEELVESYVLDAEQRGRRRKGCFIRTIVCCRLPSPNGFIVFHQFVVNEAKARFSLSVWIDVSQQYSAESLLRDFLRQVTKLKPGAHHHPLRRRPRAADPSTPLLELRLLSKEESWELLSKKAFPYHGGYRSSLFRTAEECRERNREEMRGLPLALVVLGGLLSTKGPSLWAWKRVAETLVWETSKDGRVCLDILALSYEDLPRRLKCCFLYFTDRLWVAEGFVEQRAGETLEETAEDYLEELVQRCMVIRVQDESGPIIEVSCRIHDLLHD
ncbi:unnamed protein product [Spirodela intermedia]|uniref:Uncharacterized protein n=1 Tax=Spirodela intermedia TaxID=51605 RepID=A0A7I8IU56_SPIIN|nr:unnamed protein product [Spirodela intermedia]CAA6661159.1 unnamed protein product [Spirodela intermedia]